jgi:predicted Zn-dependent protease
MQAAELSALLSAALARAGEPEADIWARNARRGFARFAGGELGQHMLIEEPRALVRVAHGRRVAEVATNRFDEAALVAAIAQAARMAPQIPEDPDFAGFASASEPAPPVVERCDPATAQSTPEERATLLAPLLERVRTRGLVSTGVLDATSSVEALSTTHGLSRSHAGTVASFKIWALESGGAGGAAGHGHDAHSRLAELDLAGETERAIRDALRSKNPDSIPAGEYDAVLEPPAVTELMEWLSFIALGAREFHQGSSPLSGRLGERISGDALTVREDPLGELSFAAPFDRDGVARKMVLLIERGIARGVLFDRNWAARLGAQSTGNASPGESFSEGGPAAAALVVDGGGAESVDELVQGVDYGVFVRRLHYVNGMLDPRRAVMTGLTRDGTFLIEKGRITRPIGNLRFTDSLLEAFERVDGMTRARRIVPNWWSESGSAAAPAVRIRRLRFTGGSQKAP